MEAWLLLPVALLPSLVIVLLAQRGAARAGKAKNGSRIPPGPLALPLLGSLLWLRHSSTNVEPLLRRLMARYDPVVSLRVGSRLSIFVADRRVAHAALVERGAALADRPEVTRGLFGETGNTVARACYGPAWRLLRRNLVSETLHPSCVRLFAPRSATGSCTSRARRVSSRSGRLSPSTFSAAVSRWASPCGGGRGSSSCR